MIDLTNWTLGLPIDKAGGFSGTAKIIDPLPQEFALEPYFTPAKGSIRFMAPCEGATTSGSHYPRSELREKVAGKLAAWLPEVGRHKLSATLAVNEVPMTAKGPGRVVVGQIHGPDDELCRLYYDAGLGEIYYMNDKALDRATGKLKEKKFLLCKAPPLDQPFSYIIEVLNKALKVRVTIGEQKYESRDPLSAFWKGKKSYFKGGAYVQAGKVGAGTVGTGRGVVTFTRIAVTHG